MSAAARLGFDHLANAVGDKPIHVIGYSNGAALALELTLDAAQGRTKRGPASIVLISPAIRIHPAARLARYKDALSAVPGLDGLGWLDVMPEFDPYKYNSFATNAGAVVHALTVSVEGRVASLDEASKQKIAPILILKSAVDSTVSTDAVVDSLLDRLAPHRNELVLFDVNRRAAMAGAMIANPGPLTRRLWSEPEMPFAVTFVTNTAVDSMAVVARRRPAFANAPTEIVPLAAEWPPGVISLSHIALPFPPDDPLYGREAPRQAGRIFLGDIALRGERGLFALPPEWLLRMRYNPFYAFAERRVLDWIASPGATGSEGSAEGSDRPPR